jgi:hypothetical protein
VPLFFGCEEVAPEFDAEFAEFLNKHVALDEGAETCEEFSVVNREALRARAR